MKPTLEGTNLIRLDEHRPHVVLCGPKEYFGPDAQTKYYVTPTAMIENIAYGRLTFAQLENGEEFLRMLAIAMLSHMAMGKISD